MPTVTGHALIITVCSSLLCFARSTQAADRYWMRPAGQPGDWSVPANWGGVEPNSNDSANVINGGTVTITQQGEAATLLRAGGGSIINQTNGSLTLSALWDEPGSFTYNLRGGLLSVDNPYYSGTISQSSGQFKVTGFGLNIGGGRGPASYNATGGTLDATRIAVGATSGGDGTMNMSSSAAGNPIVTVTGTNGMDVGGGSQGTLNMSGGTLQILAGPMTIGTSDPGIVNQTGGLISCTGLVFGRSFGFHTYSYNLDGGRLALSSIRLGTFGVYERSNFNFGGGTLQATGDFTTGMPMTLTGIGGNANLDTAGSKVTLAGKVDGPAGLNKLGLNRLVLNAINDYIGPTVVNEGTLQVNGALASSGTATVQNGATLSGMGAAGQVTIGPGGQIAPGDEPGSIGSLTFHGNLTLDSGAILDYDLMDSAASDRISMPLSTLILGGQQISDFNFSPHAGFGPGTYTLIDANSIEGTLGDKVTDTIGNYPASLSVSGGDLVLTVVPEPYALTLGLAGVGYLLAVARRRGSSK